MNKKVIVALIVIAVVVEVTVMLFLNRKHTQKPNAPTTTKTLNLDTSPPKLPE